MSAQQKKKRLKLVVEFIKLQLSGNILFWGTYIGYFLLHQLANWNDITALAIASIFAHCLFFIANKEWVFDDKTGKRKTSQEMIRFILFMGMNYFINLGIIAGLEHYLGLTPYIGQFVAGLFFSAWNFIGLRFWVFQEIQHHALTTKYVKEGKQRRARGKQRRNKSQAK